jgi:hypothetical protein
MDFTLHFRGDLTSNGDRNEKHRLRCLFHSQLKYLWAQAALQYVADPPGFAGFRDVGPYRFVPLVSEKLKLVAELTIVMLRPEVPGGVVRSGGDIDNRLKTLFDALKIPDQLNALPNGAVPAEGERPFFCLLEDDERITKVSVETHQLLEPSTKPPELVIVMHVRTRVTSLTYDNMGLA